MELADKMTFPSMAVTVDVNVVFFNSIAIKKKKKKLKNICPAGQERQDP